MILHLNELSLFYIFRFLPWPKKVKQLSFLACLCSLFIHWNGCSCSKVTTDLKKTKTKPKQKSRSWWESCNAMGKCETSQTHTAAEWIEVISPVKKIFFSYFVFKPRIFCSALFTWGRKKWLIKWWHETAKAKTTDWRIRHLSCWAVTWQEQISTPLTVTNASEHLFSARGLPELLTPPLICASEKFTGLTHKYPWTQSKYEMRKERVEDVFTWEKETE